MFNIKTNLSRRKTRYNVYQPQRYTIYVIGKWMGLIGSALLLIGLTIKWYFLLDDNSPTSVRNLLTWSLIIGSIVLFTFGAVFIVGLHWYVEKKFNSTIQEVSDEFEKTQKNLREEHRNQSKRFKQRSSWFKRYNSNSKLRINRTPNETADTIANSSSQTNSIKQNSTTIYNTNATESSFQILSNDSYLSDTTSNATSTSFSSTKKLVRTNSKFNQPTLPIIDETKQQSANDNQYTKQQTNHLITYLPDNAMQLQQQQQQQQEQPPQTTDVIFDTSKQLDVVNKSNNKTKHTHKLSSGSGKIYILENFLKQDLTENALNDQNNANSKSNQPNQQQQINNQIIISSQINQLTNANGTMNDALDLTE